MISSNNYAPAIARNLKLPLQQVTATLSLLDDGGTVPFIARYRKEATGSLDEVAIDRIRMEQEKLQEIEKRRKSIIDSLTKNDRLTDKLLGELQGAESLTTLEDIYLPHRPKRKTRALMAAEKGLQPLAELLLSGRGNLQDIDKFINPEQGVDNQRMALDGAKDIIAEKINEDQSTREKLRTLFLKRGIIAAKVVKKNIEQGEKFSNYFDWQETASEAPGHRLLAMFRGETKKILTLTIRPPQEEALRILTSLHIPSNLWQDELKGAAEDSYKRLLCPSLENELRKELKQKADAEAIEIFGGNLRQLLLTPPLGQKSVLALDPGYRTGAKLVCLDRQGKLLDTTTIYPTHNATQQTLAAEIIRDKIDTHRIEAIAIGNGTAGRETEAFVRSMELDSTIIITMVNEDGASIYSASEAARLEFPDRDITVRGAVSIGRRLQDPLAELVKIDPKSIGVGQYQHDVDQHRLKSKLQSIVESCVNSVGVELNSASAELLTFISGLGRTLADNILDYRNSNGPFKTRRELLKVPRLGPKAYEQCAGFLRIRNGSNPLDNSAVHPERYKLIQQMAKDAAVSLPAFLQSEETRKGIKLEDYIDASVGMPTLLDIMKELNKPGRDPRDTFKQFCFADNIFTIDDIREGMLLPAIITNVTKFGAFADLGIKQDGLIHISQMADRFIKDPGEVVRVRQQVEVRILQVDTQRKRIALSLRKE
ncbi:MAG: RNA-binding transcriptional accessory protein [Deltaproteobacteria bacterium]|nr:RNA-binding transcriptional accessory protein [Deltaproteobacteria bacterium]